jgi:hypothetical protein
MAAIFKYFGGATHKPRAESILIYASADNMRVSEF